MYFGRAKSRALRRATDGTCHIGSPQRLAEMAEHQAHGGPSAILMLTQPLYQNIYFADAGRQAAETLLRKLNIKGGHQIQ